MNIYRSGDPFAFHQHIVSCVDTICAELEREGHLVGTDPDQFANRGAYYLGEMNDIYPFREGNGRAQREFIREVAAGNGLEAILKRAVRVSSRRDGSPNR